MRRWGLLLVLLLAPLAARAQRPGRIVVRPPVDTGRARGDTTRKDTAVVKWSSPDSVMERLSKTKGYTVTRYEGQIVTFDALSKAIQIAAEGARKAAVQRGDQTVVTDSTIRYVDRHVTVMSRDSAGRYTIVPGGGQAPIAGRTTATYDLAERSGRINQAQFVVDNGGQKWYVTPDAMKVEVGDTTKKIPGRIYGVGGSLTSCDDSIPDYHFEVSEVKRTANTLVARPAVLYIGDVPVMWLPFMFQDIRNGRRSGMLTPRFGVSDIVRNSPTYRRDIENIGYYWALNPYMDAQLWMDWRSPTGGSSTGDPGFTRFNGEWRYAWRNRFLQGQIAAAYTNQRDGQTNLALSWAHSQDFSRNSRLTANLNYVTSTSLQRQNTFNPYAAMATISSSLNYSQKLGPAQLSIGGTRKQYPGRDQVDQTLPTLSLTTSPISAGSWLVWTPSFSYTASQTLHIDQPGLFSQRYFTNTTGALDSAAVKRSNYTSSMSFDTPIQIFGFDLKNSFRINDQQNIFPQQYVIYPNPNDTSVKETRVFASTYRTDVDWTPSFALPPFLHGMFNLTPSVSFQNVDPSAFWVRTERTGGQFVHQSKRPVFGVSAAPTVYGLIDGFGPFTRLRHTISPTVSWSYAPSATVSDEFLTAIGRTRVGYLGSLPQNALTFGLNQNLEAKFRPKRDSTGNEADTPQPPIQLLSLNLTPLSYDFERARATHRAISGLTTESFGYSISSGLLPGFSVNVGYSLFQGSTLSDTAVFKPYRNSVSANLNISQQQNPFAFILRMLGVPQDTTPPAPPTPGQPGPSPSDAYARQLASQPVAGSGSRNALYLPPVSRSWQAQFSFNSARTRPPVGGTVINSDPAHICAPFKLPTSPSYNPAAYDLCLQQQSTTPTLDQPISNTTAGGPVYINPPTASLGSNISFPLTEKWSASWQTTYDFERHEFASHIVSLQRDLHDWMATFAFTQSPNGNFAFNFFIALKAEPDLKFTYNRGTYRGVPLP